MSFYLNADEVFEVGLEIEKNGKRFYELAAEKAPDASVRELCRGLAEWEAQHVSVFRKLRDDLPEAARRDAPFDPDSEEAQYAKAMADSHVFLQERKVEDLVGDCRNAAQFLSLAMSFEKDSILFYSAIKPLVLPEHGQSSVETLILEEQRHLATLAARKNELEE